MEYRRGRIPGLIDPQVLGTPTLADIMLSDGPMALWAMDDTAGLPKDRSGYGNHLRARAGTIDYTTVDGWPCVDMAAGVWDGPSLASNGPFTLEAFVYPTGTKPAGNQGDGAIIGAWSSGSGTMLFQASPTSSVPYRAYLQSSYGSSTTNQKFHEWQHLAATWDGTTLRFYYNGVQEATVAGGTLAGSAIQVSGYASSSDRKFGGYAHHLAVYPHALTADRIAAHHQAGLR